jgi:hypothetical protein
MLQIDRQSYCVLQIVRQSRKGTELNTGEVLKTVDMLRSVSGGVPHREEGTAWHGGSVPLPLLQQMFRCCRWVVSAGGLRGASRGHACVCT